MTGAVSFVLGSAARREVLSRLADGEDSGRGIVVAADASESAVYDALGRLADRGLVTETADGTWGLTGAGRLVADTVERCERLDGVIGGDTDYWASHDPTGLPASFRRSIDRLECCEVVRSPDTDPYRAARRVERAIEDARTVAIVAPVYSDRHAEALLESDAERSRLVMTPGMVSRIVEDEPAGPEPNLDGLSIRVQPAAISMTVTDGSLLFSLPTPAGSFDATTEVVAEGDAAIEWGRSLFEHYWERGTPVGQWLANEHPDAGDSVHVHEHGTLAETVEEGADAGSDGSAGRTETPDGSRPVDDG
ncbi:helix-turn-helix transcriptional regulator [Salinarchaeum chitinilyticum]